MCFSIAARHRGAGAESALVCGRARWRRRRAALRDTRVGNPIEVMGKVGVNRPATRTPGAACRTTKVALSAWRRRSTAACVRVSKPMRSGQTRAFRGGWSTRRHRSHRRCHRRRCRSSRPPPSSPGIPCCPATTGRRATAVRPRCPGACRRAPDRVPRLEIRWRNPQARGAACAHRQAGFPRPAWPRGGPPYRKGAR